MTTVHTWKEIAPPPGLVVRWVLKYTKATTPNGDIGDDWVIRFRSFSTLEKAVQFHSPCIDEIGGFPLVTLYAVVRDESQALRRFEWNPQGNVWIGKAAKRWEIRLSNGEQTDYPMISIRRNSEPPPSNDPCLILARMSTRIISANEDDFFRPFNEITFINARRAAWRHWVEIVGVLHGWHDMESEESFLQSLLRHPLSQNADDLRDTGN